MALKRPRWKPGTVVTLEHASSVLKDNPLGDPHVRKLALWLPPQYDAGAGRGRGRRFPVPFVDREFRTLASREHRGCFGKSSGGYGAMLHGMKYASTWGAIADHSGDAYFDFVYWHDWPNTLNELAKYRARRQKAGRYDAPRAAKAAGRGLDDGRVRRFLAAVWKKPKLSMAEGHCIMNLCMAATYDPDPAAPNGFRLPFNLETGEVLPERWRQWQRHDPVRLVERYQRNLRSLSGIYIDCGWRDQFHIH